MARVITELSGMFHEKCELNNKNHMVHP